MRQTLFYPFQKFPKLYSHRSTFRFQLFLKTTSHALKSAWPHSLAPFLPSASPLHKISLTLSPQCLQEHERTFSCWTLSDESLDLNKARGWWTRFRSKFFECLQFLFSGRNLWLAVCQLCMPAFLFSLPRCSLPCGQKIPLGVGILWEGAVRPIRESSVLPHQYFLNHSF